MPVYLRLNFAHDIWYLKLFSQLGVQEALQPLLHLLHVCYGIGHPACPHHGVLCQDPARCS